VTLRHAQGGFLVILEPGGGSPTQEKDEQNDPSSSPQAEGDQGADQKTGQEAGFGQKLEIKASGDENNIYQYSPMYWHSSLKK
jgi:hypothetical protein